MNYARVGLGRMGRAVDEQARERGHRAVVTIDPAARGRGTRRSVAESDLAGVDVAFEFTVPSAAEDNVVALLEGKMIDVLVRAATSGRKVYAVTELVEPEELLEPEGMEGHYDPHLWMDPLAGAKAAPRLDTNAGTR